MQAPFYFKLYLLGSTVIYVKVDSRRNSGSKIMAKKRSGSNVTKMEVVFVALYKKPEFSETLYNFIVQLISEYYAAMLL